ncbi:hypothetical protein [Oscillibacter sp.]|uniref:hypothetical protein n=1 Tax=Oscillibacter sp. TaxID=1945593 RepID=UPI00261E149D|nr:hypothetical protein [Oscillibacter sp.]MDD3347370.1 hypothetical protein [Oscillibacter sp.]
MSLRKRRRLSMCVLAGGIATMVFAGEAAMAPGALLVLAGLALDVLLVRCPRCGAWLGNDPGEFCKNCGTEIDYKAK